jgi:hypothetical protein
MMADILISGLNRMSNLIDKQNDVLALQDVSTGETVKITLDDLFLAEVTTNNIGTPGAAGFGVGVYPDTLPAYMAAMTGTFDPTHAQLRELSGYNR